MLSVLGSHHHTGSGSHALSIPAGTKAVLWAGSEATAVSIGGVSFTSGSGPAGGGVWQTRCFYALDISGRANDTGVTTGGTEGVFLFVGGIDPTLLAASAISGLSASVPQGVPPSGNAVVLAYANSNSGSLDGVGTGLVDIVERVGSGTYYHGAGYIEGGVGDNIAPGFINGSFFNSQSTISLYEATVHPELIPDPVTVEVAVESTGLSIDIGASRMLFLSPPQRVEVAIQIDGLAVTATAARQVALVGGGIETSEMTDGGTEGQVLTYHESRKPTWEDGGGAGATALDDLIDVDVPAPADGEVLAWDDYQQLWVAAVPAASGPGRLVLADGITDPPEPVWTEDGTDFIYEEDFD